MIYRSCIARIVLLLCVGVCVHAEDYYLDSQTGDDRNDGLSPANAWATLTKASAGSYQAGDRILLKRGVPFKGKLSLRHIIAGSDQPLVVDAYGKGEQLPKIDSAGYIGGITIEDCSYVKVRNIEISSDGGVAVDSKAKTDRYGIYVSKSNNISIENLNIHAIFATEQTKSEGKDNTTAYGHGARIEDSERVQVRACRIERVGRYGINALRSDDLLILNNQTDHTGCSGLQMSRCKGVEVRGNIFDHPGSFIDERMHGRGSGSWVWSCEDVRYESNHFLNAKGKGDSCGVHIDFN